MRTLKGHLKQLSPVKTSDTFYVVLRSKIRQELERETLPEKVLNFFRIYRWPSFATGLAALILVIFISYSDIFQPKTTSPISSQLTESGQLISAKPKHVVTPPPGVFLVVEETDKENLFDRGEKLNSETLSSKRQDLTVYYDSTRIYQPRPVGVYLTTPKPSAAF